MKRCKACGTSAKLTAKSCPECGKYFKIGFSSNNSNNYFKMFALVAIALVAVFFVKSGGKKYTPEEVVQAFFDSVVDNDTSTLEKVLYLPDKMKIDSDSVESLIEYFNNNYSEFTTIMDSLNNDIANSNTLNRKGSTKLLESNELFALTIKDKGLFSTKYAITFKPFYVNVNSNNLESKIYLNDDKFASIEANEGEKKIGPLLPIDWNITLKSEDLFGNEITDSEYINIPYIAANYGSDNYTLYLFEDYKTVQLVSNVPEATIFVNNESINKSINDFPEGFGPIGVDNTIYLSYSVKNNTYITERQSLSDSSYLTLDFSQNDYKKISAYLNGGSIENDNVSSIAKTFINKYENRDYIIPTSNSVELTFKDLNNYTAEELYLARHELFARYGYVDPSYPNLVSYFESKPWFSENSGGSTPSLSEVEKINYDMIRSLEFLKMARDKYSDIYVDYVFPNSNSQELTESQVSMLNDWEIVVARNELFARYGLAFSTKELLSHFKSKSWFKIDTSVGNDLALNEVENANLKIILNEERRRMDIKLNHDLGN